MKGKQKIEKEKRVVLIFIIIITVILIIYILTVYSELSKPSQPPIIEIINKRAYVLISFGTYTEPTIVSPEIKQIIAIEVEFYNKGGPGNVLIIANVKQDNNEWTKTLKLEVVANRTYVTSLEFPEVSLEKEYKWDIFVVPS
jgi:hypothetical protein